LAEGELLAEGPAREAQFWTSADPLHFRNILPILWNTSGIVRSFNK
jgi:glutamate racemase